MLLSFPVYLFPFLLCFEKAASSGKSIGFKRWGDGKTYRFICTAFICNYKIGVQRIQTTFPAFDRGIE